MSHRAIVVVVLVAALVLAIPVASVAAGVALVAAGGFADRERAGGPKRWHPLRERRRRRSWPGWR